MAHNGTSRSPERPLPSETPLLNGAHVDDLRITVTPEEQAPCSPPHRGNPYIEDTQSPIPRLLKPDNFSNLNSETPSVTPTPGTPDSGGVVEKLQKTLETALRDGVVPGSSGDTSGDNDSPGFNDDGRMEEKAMDVSEHRSLDRLERKRAEQSRLKQELEKLDGEIVQLESAIPQPRKRHNQAGHHLLPPEEQPLLLISPRSRPRALKKEFKDEELFTRDVWKRLQARENVTIFIDRQPRNWVEDCCHPCELLLWFCLIALVSTGWGCYVAFVRMRDPEHPLLYASSFGTVFLLVLFVFSLCMPFDTKTSILKYVPSTTESSARLEHTVERKYCFNLCKEYVSDECAEHSMDRYEGLTCVEKEAPKEERARAHERSFNHKTLQFSTDRLGFRCAGNEVTSVEIGSQAWRRQVKTGWQIRRITYDDKLRKKKIKVPVQTDTTTQILKQLLKAAKKSSEGYLQITFAKTKCAIHLYFWNGVQLPIKFDSDGGSIGLVYRKGTAKVLRVEAGSQAERMGVAPNWEVRSVGGETVDVRNVKRMVERTAGEEVSFFRPETPNVVRLTRTGTQRLKRLIQYKISRCQKLLKMGSAIPDKAMSAITSEDSWE